LTTDPDRTGAGGGDAVRDLEGRSFRFRLSRADMVAYEIAVRRLDWRTRVILTLMVGLAGLTVAVLPDSLPSWIWWALTVLLLAGAMTGSVVFTNMDIRRRAVVHRLPGGDTTVELRGDGVFEAADGSDRLVPYRAVEGVFETPGHLFLKVAEGPVAIPLSAFAADGDMAATAEWLRERVFRARRPAAAGVPGEMS
jgi:hypothetical protein